jgi:hypothetical protein
VAEVQTKTREQKYAEETEREAVGSCDGEFTEGREQQQLAIWWRVQGAREAAASSLVVRWRRERECLLRDGKGVERRAKLRGKESGGGRAKEKKWRRERKMRGIFGETS